jgi:hypothetical protein
MTETEHSVGLELRPEWVTRPELFWAKIERRGADDCWEWQASGYQDGYGKHQLKTPKGWRERAAHRIAYVLATNTPLRAGVHILHSCDNRACCNPNHLSLGDRIRNRKEALDRGRWKRRSIRGGQSASAKKVVANGVEYPSAVDAAQALGLNYFTVAARARNGIMGFRYD